VRDVRTVHLLKHISDVAGCRTACIKSENLVVEGGKAGLSFANQGVASANLFENFEKWANAWGSVFELSDQIHSFQNGISRELYGRYTDLDPFNYGQQSRCV